jgi:hypothetical protein
MANENKNCEECFSPYMDDRKKIIFQGMEFCDINCFMNSRYFDIEELSVVKEAREDAEAALEDFKESEDDKATAEAANKQIVTQLGELLKRYDDRFEQGNKELDEILLEISKIKEDGEI